MAPVIAPAAIANAIDDSVGVRLRSVPFMPVKMLSGWGRSVRVGGSC